MLSDRVTKVSFFKIHRHEGHGWTVYEQWGHMTVNAGQHGQPIRDFAESGLVDNPGNISIEDRRPERYLDVDAENDSNVQAFAFYLNAYYEGRNRLEFIPGKPFIFLPVNAALPDGILEEPEAVNSRCAYFVFDVRTARESDLAEQVKNYASPHLPTLNIPFCFNLYDPVLRAAPWLVSSYHPAARGHSHGADDHDEDHGKPLSVGGAVPLTHGGVHPSTASFLSIAPE